MLDRMNRNFYFRFTEVANFSSPKSTAVDEIVAFGGSFSTLHSPDVSVFTEYLLYSTFLENSNACIE